MRTEQLGHCYVGQQGEQDSPPPWPTRFCAVDAELARAETIFRQATAAGSAEAPTNNGLRLLQFALQLLSPHNDAVALASDYIGTAAGFLADDAHIPLDEPLSHYWTACSHNTLPICVRAAVRSRAVGIITRDAKALTFDFSCSQIAVSCCRCVHQGAAAIYLGVRPFGQCGRVPVAGLSGRLTRHAVPTSQPLTPPRASRCKKHCRHVEIDCWDGARGPIVTH
eukprot:3299718-Prymnesium_polylepis.1